MSVPDLSAAGPDPRKRAYPTGGGPPGILAASAWALYEAAASVIVPGILRPALALGGRASELDERLGRRTLPLGGSPRVLIHAVSAGEMQGALALASALLETRSAGDVVLSTGTRHGRIVAERFAQGHSSASVSVVYLPWDRPRAVRRWLAAAHIDAVAIVETEIWPGLFQACVGLGIPLVLASARIDSRDAARYRWLRHVWPSTLRAPRRILAQDPDQAARFRSVGFPADIVRVGGNLKFDRGPSGGPSARTTHRGGAPVVAAVSTHAPEERLLLRAWASILGALPDCRLVVAPRDPRRAPAIAKAAAGAGFRVAMSDRPDDLGAGDVVVVSGFGQLGPVYDAARVVFVGGTIARVGGHSVIEPAALGIPCIVGPRIEHVAGIVSDLEQCRGIVRLRARVGPAAVAEAVVDLLRTPGRADTIGGAARAYCVARRGAAALAAAEVRSLIARPASRSAVPRAPTT